MRIRSGLGECFPPLAEWALEDLPPGLCVFHGANETGKSLLVRLVGGILCGFVPGEWKGAAGRPIGGRLVIVAAGGEYTIERWLGGAEDVRVTRPDGRPGSRDDLARLTGGADGERWRALCVLGLSDIGTFSLGGPAEIGALALNPALGAARRTGARACARIDSESARLFSGHGHGRIDVAVAELNRLRPRLDAARRAAAGYDSLLAAAEEASGEVERLGAELRARRAERERLRQWLDLWPAWQALDRARAELAAIDPAGEPPAGDVPDNRALAAELDEVQSQLRVLEAECDRARFSREALDASLPGLIERWQDEVARSAASGAAPHAGGSGGVAAAAAPVASRQPAAVPEARSVAARLAEVRGWERRLRTVRSEERAAEEALAIAVRQRDEMRRRLDDAERSLAEIDAGGRLHPEALARQRNALARVRAAQAVSESERATATALRQQIGEGERVMRILEAEGDPDLPPWLVLAIVVAILGSVYVLLEVGAAEDSWTTLIVLVMAVLAALNGIYELRQWVARRKRARKKLIQGLRAELRRARQGSGEGLTEAPHWSEALAAERAELDLPREPSAEDLAACEARLAVSEAESSRREAAALHVRELSGALAECEERLRGLTEDLSSARKRLGTANAEWAAWRGEVGFAGDLAPEQVHALLVYGNGRAAGAEPEAAVPGSRRTAEVGNANGAAMVERFMASLRQDLAGRSSHWQETIAAREETIALLRRREAELLRMGGTAGTGGGSDGERRRRTDERRSDLLRVIAEREQEIDWRLGDAAAREEGRRQLGRGRPEAWRESLPAVDAAIERVEAALASARAEAEARRQACRALEESAELANLEIEWNGWMTELEAAVDRWRLLAAARGLVEESLRGLERTAEPPALAAASRSLAAASAGRYERIAQDESGRALVLVDRAGRRKRVPDDLSRSTLEQVCLCLRLAAADVRVGGGEALPLIADDPLVNADPERARGMASVLGAVATVRQILYFTCHPETRDLLREVAGAARVVEL